jgi:hypothetical protein
LSGHYWSPGGSDYKIVLCLLVRIRCEITSSDLGPVGREVGSWVLMDLKVSGQEEHCSTDICPRWQHWLALDGSTFGLPKNIFLKKVKAIPVTGHGGLQSFEMLRISHCLDSRLTDGGEVVSLTRRPPHYSPQTLFLCFCTHFFRGWVNSRALLRPEGLGKLIRIIHLFGSRTRDLPA